jgi:MerR family transcriptional regulator/heat shock protein HspR
VEHRDDARTPRYVISVASRLAGVPAHTLRAYEKAELVRPYRTEGNVRLFSDEDLRLVRRIVELDELGVNKVGIKIILELEQSLGSPKK